VIPLPPKRFQDPADPVYDPIRHKPWFGKLLKRRAKLPLLEQALKRLGDCSQKQAAEEFGLDERELRDYLHWAEGVVEGIPMVAPCIGRKYQAVLDDANSMYQHNNGYAHIRFYIELWAPLWGMKPRHVTELWEVDPTFLPLGYNLTKPKEGK
jgi:hypothetical protein